MILSEIKLAVKKLFGDEAGVQITDADIVRWANDGMIDICRKTDAASNITTISTVVGTDTYIIAATDFLRISRVTFAGKDLSYISWRQLNELYPSRDVAPVSTGTPSLYSLIRRQLVLYPAPTSVGVVSMTYAARPMVLTGDADTPNIPTEMHEDLVRYILMRAYELDGNEGGVARVGADFSQRINQSRADLNFPLTEIYPSIQDVS